MRPLKENTYAFSRWPQVRDSLCRFAQSIEVNEWERKAYDFQQLCGNAKTLFACNMPQPYGTNPPVLLNPYTLQELPYTRKAYILVKTGHLKICEFYIGKASVIALTRSIKKRFYLDCIPSDLCGKEFSAIPHDKPTQILMPNLCLKPQVCISMLDRLES